MRAALGEFEVIGVVDDAGGVGVLVIDADGIAVDALGDEAGARQLGAHGRASSSSSASRSSCAALRAQRFEAEIAVDLLGHEPPARRALHEALLDEIGLDHLLDDVALLAQRRRHGLDADGSAAVVLARCTADSGGRWHRGRLLSTSSRRERIVGDAWRRCASPRRRRRNRAPGAAAASPRGACRASGARSRRRRRHREPWRGRARRARRSPQARPARRRSGAAECRSARAAAG